MSNLYGVSAYQQTNGVWNNKTNNTKNEKTRDSKESQTKGTDKIKTTEFKPIDTKSPLVPSVKNGYGNVIGDVELSDKAKDYYDKLKAKFHNMDFILVSKDMEETIRASGTAYGNAAKQGCVSDDEKIGNMATDGNFRKKYEGIIAMSQLKLQEAKNSLTSSGASVKNFGMSVDSNGKMSFFATVEKAAEKKAEEKAAEEVSNEPIDDKEYVEIKADSMDELVDKISTYAYDSSSRNVLTDSEKQVGQKFDIKW